MNQAALSRFDVVMSKLRLENAQIVKLLSLPFGEEVLTKPRFVMPVAYIIIIMEEIVILNKCIFYDLYCCLRGYLLFVIFFSYWYSIH